MGLVCRRGRATTLLAVAALSACAAHPAATSIAAKSYDRQCSTAADCVGVYEGQVGCCYANACANAAISQSAAATYFADLSRAATVSCGSGPQCPVIDFDRPGGCPGGVACDEGLCTFHQAASDAAPSE
jgi:hypothetical protein